MATDEPTTDDQNIIVLVLGAVLGVALIVVVAIVIMLTIVCYRNKAVSIAYLCNTSCIEPVTKL